MTYECDQCGMDFETTAQLANHKKKFCMGQNGTEEAIERRLEELKRVEHDLDYAATDNRLTGGRPGGGGPAIQLQSPHAAASLRQSGPASGGVPRSYHNGNPGGVAASSNHSQKQ